MNKLSLNFKYTALQILYWAEASIVFVYVGFYLQAAGMSNGSVGVTIAFANILSFALSKDGLRPEGDEWERTEEYLMPQLKALTARYSKLGDNAFYKYYLPVDETVTKALTAQ